MSFKLNIRQTTTKQYIQGSVRHDRRLLTGNTCPAGKSLCIHDGMWSIMRPVRSLLLASARGLFASEERQTTLDLYHSFHTPQITATTKKQVASFHDMNRMHSQTKLFQIELAILSPNDCVLDEDQGVLIFTTLYKQRDRKRFRAVVPD